MDYEVHVFSTMWRSKSQPSNSTSCGDIALRLLVLVTGGLKWRLQVTSSFFNLGLCFEGLFWERYILKGQIVFEGHWRLQSWRLGIIVQITFKKQQFTFSDAFVSILSWDRWLGVWTPLPKMEVSLRSVFLFEVVMCRFEVLDEGFTITEWLLLAKAVATTTSILFIHSLLWWCFSDFSKFM